MTVATTVSSAGRASEQRCDQEVVPQKVGHVTRRPPVKVYKSDVPEENLTFSLFLRSWKVVESKDRNPSFHLLYQPPLLVIVETNAGSRKFGEDHEAFVCAPACTIYGSIVTRHYAFTLCLACE